MVSGEHEASTRNHLVSPLLHFYPHKQYIHNLVCVSLYETKQSGFSFCICMIIYQLIIYLYKCRLMGNYDSLHV